MRSPFWCTILVPQHDCQMRIFNKFLKYNFIFFIIVSVQFKDSSPLIYILVFRNVYKLIEIYFYLFSTWRCNPYTTRNFKVLYFQSNVMYIDMKLGTMIILLL